MNNKDDSTVIGALESLLDGVLGQYGEEAKQRYLALCDHVFVQRGLQAVVNQDPPLFHIHFSWELEKLAEGVIRAGLATIQPVEFSKLRTLFIHQDFISGHFRAVIDEVEGGACCADKTRFLMRGLARFFALGEPLTFKRNQEYTFHLPTKVFVTHEEVVLYFDALHSLYYGRPEKFLSAHATVMQRKACP